MMEFECDLVLQLFELLSTAPVPDQKKSENKTSTSV